MHTHTHIQSNYCDLMILLFDTLILAQSYNKVIDFGRFQPILLLLLLLLLLNVRFYLQNENTKCKYLCAYDIFQGEEEEKKNKRKERGNQYTHTHTE